MELREGGSVARPEEAMLVERAKGDDVVAAYEELVRGHQAVAFRTAISITGDATEAEDVARRPSSRSTAPRSAPYRLALPPMAADHRGQRGQKPAPGDGRRLGLKVRTAEQRPQTGAPSSSETSVVDQ
jgi:hypothetical protein